MKIFTVLLCLISLTISLSDASAYRILSLEWYPGWNRRPEFDMSRQSLSKHVYVQTISDGNYLYPSYRAFEKLLCVHCTFRTVYIQIIVRSKTPISKLSCIANQCVCLLLFVRCKIENLCVHWLLCVQKHLWPNFYELLKVFSVQISVLSPDKKIFVGHVEKLQMKKRRYRKIRKTYIVSLATWSTWTFQ